MEEITTLEEMAALIRSDRPTLLFKYSPTCGISQVAQEAWEPFAANETILLLAQCDVIKAKPAARGMVEMVGVAHQSPQILALRCGKCVGHASHYSITPAWIRMMRDKLLQGHALTPPVEPSTSASTDIDHVSG